MQIVSFKKNLFKIKWGKSPVSTGKDEIKRRLWVLSPSSLRTTIPDMLPKPTSVWAQYRWKKNITHIFSRNIVSEAAEQVC